MLAKSCDKRTTDNAVPVDHVRVTMKTYETMHC